MLRLALLNINEWCKDFPTVTSPNIMYRTRSFHKDGLFSEVLFGPVKDYSCSCGKVHGRENVGVTCKYCGVTCDTSEKRRTTFGKIDIPENITIVNPITLDMMDSVISIPKLKLSKVISGKQTIKLVDDEL